MFTFAAVKLFFSGLLQKFLSICAKAFAWFMSLETKWKFAFFLIISVLLNLVQCSNNWNHKAEKKAAVQKVHDEYVKRDKIAEEKAIKIIEDKQSIWDLFVEEARKDTDKEILKLKKDQEKVRIVYEKIKAENPLPVGCVFNDNLVRYANQTIADVISKQ